MIYLTGSFKIAVTKDEGQNQERQGTGALRIRFRWFLAARAGFFPALSISYHILQMIQECLIWSLIQYI